MRAFRLDRGIYRLKLGDLVGVSDHQIMKYELGQDHISAGLLWKICSILRCPIDSIFIPTEIGRVGLEAAQDDAPLPDEQAILAAFRRITPPEVRMRVARLILSLAAQGAEAERDGPEG
nr:helix-turn-helix domain-containing protein [Methylobacterium sp. SyP6R]